MVNEASADETKCVGLCADCQHMRLIQSDRGSKFYMCLKSLTDARFSKYPRLPVTQCTGYESKESP
ncbi:MAG: hypothetical protein DMG98_06080 [Acidobacteria bacterium]|nr:MAG: hypothetical protein DMG98_06080 [Acidobacteriota bacterium]